MLRCSDNSIYTGIAADVQKRFKEHANKSEKAAKYTRTHTALKLEIVWQSETRSDASRLEYYIKSLPKIKKEKLIECKSLEILQNKINTEIYSLLKTE